MEVCILGSAIAEFQDRGKGSIISGKLADLVLRSDELIAIPPQKIPEANVLTTIVEGKLVVEWRAA